jgi:hypothetical protein
MLGLASTLCVTILFGCIVSYRMGWVDGYSARKDRERGTR